MTNCDFPASPRQRVRAHTRSLYMNQTYIAPSPPVVATSLEDVGFILLTDLRSIVPLHPQHIRKLVRRGEFPTPVCIGGRAAFRRSDIREWCNRQSKPTADPNRQLTR